MAVLTSDYEGERDGVSVQQKDNGINQNQTLYCHCVHGQTNGEASLLIRRKGAEILKV